MFKLQHEELDKLKEELFLKEAKKIEDDFIAKALDKYLNHLALENEGSKMFFQVNYSTQNSELWYKEPSKGISKVVAANYCDGPLIDELETFEGLDLTMDKYRGLNAIAPYSIPDITMIKECKSVEDLEV